MFISSAIQLCSSNILKVLYLVANYRFVCFVFFSGAEESKTISTVIQNGSEEDKQTTDELEKGMKALTTNDTTSTPASPPAKPPGGTPEGSPSKSPSKKKKKFKPPSFLKKSKKQKEKMETWGARTLLTLVKYCCEMFLFTDTRSITHHSKLYCNTGTHLFGALLKVFSHTIWPRSDTFNALLLTTHSCVAHVFIYVFICSSLTNHNLIYAVDLCFHNEWPGATG